MRGLSNIRATSRFAYPAGAGYRCHGIGKYSPILNITKYLTDAVFQLLPLMLSEVTFVHQRGLVYGVYWATQNVVTSALNLASSYEAAALGWRWFYWVYVIAVGVGLFIVVLTCFETKYQRRAQVLNGQVVVTDQFGVTQVLTGDQAQVYLQAVAQTEDDFVPDEMRLKKTYLQMLMPWGNPASNPLRVVVTSWLHMFEAFSSPGILYATLLASVVLGSSIGMSLTYDTVLQGKGWPAKSIGLINLGGVFGGFGGMLYAGVFGDWFILRMARRNNGVHTPEHRLLLLLAPGILVVVSLILYGCTADGSTTWGGPYMGWTLLQVAFVSVLILSTAFAAEAWEKNPGPALVAVVGTKNIISFGISYGLNPMVEKYSYPVAMGILAGVCGGVFLLGIPVYFFNPVVSILWLRGSNLSFLRTILTFLSGVVTCNAGNRRSRSEFRSIHLVGTMSFIRCSSSYLQYYNKAMFVGVLGWSSYLHQVFMTASAVHWQPDS